MTVEYDERKLNQIIRQHPAQADEWLNGVAVQMENEMKLSMTSSPATGKTYRRGQGRVHVASSEGNAPRPDMGALLASIRTVKRGRLHYEHRDGVEYGIYLEFGTERMGVRPWVNPVYDAWRRKIVRDAMERLIT